MAWPITKAAKAATSLTMSIETRRTISLPKASSTRRGTAARVVRIDPAEYSLVTKSAPMMPTANWAKTMPMRLVLTGSKVILVAKFVELQCVRTRVVTSAPMPRVKTNVTTTPTMDARTLLNLSHSERKMEPRVTS